jgi:hypothetical protein
MPPCSVRRRERNQLSPQLMLANFVELTYCASLDVLGDVALYVRLLVLYFQEVDGFFHSIVASYRIVIIPYKEVGAENGIF